MANTTVNNYGSARSTARVTYPANADMPLGGYNAGEALVQNAGLSEEASVALGQTWQMCIPAANHFTHVAAWPTTRAELVMKNNYGAASGVAVVIRSIWSANDATSAAAASSFTLLAQIVASSATAVTDNTAVLITSASGKSGYGGSVTRAIANTSYGIADKWQVLAPSVVTGAATIGTGCYAPINGALILPPQALLLLNMVVSTATGTAIIGVSWDEKVIPLG